MCGFLQDQLEQIPVVNHFQKLGADSLVAISSCYDAGNSGSTVLFIFRQMVSLSMETCGPES